MLIRSPRSDGGADASLAMKVVPIERAWVHYRCGELGLKSRSEGKGNVDIILDHLSGISGLFTNVDIILDHLSGISGLFTTPHTPCTVLYLVTMLIGCWFAGWCLRSDVAANSRRQARGTTAF